MDAKLFVIVVTHNSRQVLPLCLHALSQSTFKPAGIAVVDAGSSCTQYLEDIAGEGLFIIKERNIGYGRANNLGYTVCPGDAQYILFLNPDCLVSPTALERAVQILDEHTSIACVGARLQGFDLEKQRATGRLDSTGIFRSWYGRWFDRGQGEPDGTNYQWPQETPAACGAFLCCRKEALAETALAPDTIFDPAFFLYKEDIELCLRLRDKGWRIVYHPAVQAMHARGWAVQRSEVPYPLRREAAKNEVLLYRRHPSIYMLWALAKYVLVRLFRL